MNGNGKSEMAFEFMIPKTAKVDEKSGKIEITLASLIEGDKIDDGDPDKTNITSIAVSFAPTTVKVGDAMPTITIGDVVPAEAKADIEYKWVKADGTAAGATAEAGSYKIQLSVKADSNYQIVDGTTAVTGTTELTVAGSVTADPTVRAIFDATTKSYKLYSYEGKAMTEEDVKSAISTATGRTVTDLKFDTTQTTQYVTAEFESGNPVKIFVNASVAGSNVKPETLREVTMPNGDKKYLYNGEIVTGLTAGKSYIDVSNGFVKATSGDAILTAGANGNGAITLNTADVVLAEALAMPASLTNLSVFVQYDGKEMPATANNLIPAGSTLIVRYTLAADAGKTVEFDVEGDKKTATADESGMAQVTYGPINSMKGATLTISATASALYTVTLNGTEVAKDVKAGDNVILNGVKLAELYVPTASNNPVLKALAANSGKTYDISSGVNYCVNASDTDTTEINIVEAIEVKNGVTGAKIYKDWKSNDDKGTQVAASSAEFVKKGTELFLVADTANTIFDAVDGSGLVLTNAVSYTHLRAHET